MANDSVVRNQEPLYAFAQVPAQALLPSQVPPSAPDIVQTQSGTDLLIADRTIRSRMDHFPGDLYDLRAESHLVRFVGTLIGDAGAGALRKRYLVARLNSVLASANFYDLDGFYGAIFGSGRRHYERLGIDPYTDVEVPDEWDQIQARDARYRERIYALAAAIPMAGTVAGLRQAAEAITGVECEVYEIWRFIDVSTNTVAAMPTWADTMASYATWADIQGTEWPANYTVGGLGVTTPAEIVIRPKKTYSAADPEQMRERNLNELALLRVLHLLRPASTVITVDEDGVELHKPVSLASVDADSEYWEVVSKVTPNPIIRPVPRLYPLSASQESSGVGWGQERTMPRPPMIASQGMTWEQASNVVTVSAASVYFENDDLDQPGSGAETVDNPLNFQSVTYFDGTTVAYSAERGAADPKTVQGGLTSAGGVLAVAPYAAPRTTTEPR